MLTTITVLDNQILSKGQAMETIEFKNPHFGMNLKVVADASYHTGEYGEYGVLNAAYVQIGEQIVEIADHEMLVEIMANQGWFESIEQIAEYEKEAYA